MTKKMEPMEPMEQMVIPTFSSETEEAAWWDTHRLEIEAEIRRQIKKKPLMLNNLLRAEKTTQSITLRISKADLEAARRQAAKRGVGYQTYIKMLLRDALRREKR